MVSRPAHTLLDYLHRLADERGRCALADAELLDRFADRHDPDAFESLVWRHGPMVWGVCRRVLRDGHAAEDAFQATFLVLARKAEGIGRRTALAGWLYRVAYRISLRARRDITRRTAREQPLVDVAERPGRCPRTEPDWLPILDEELHQLPEKYRLPVVLCHLQGRTLAEAAVSLGCPRGTIAVRLRRARERLRKRLADRGVELPAVITGLAASRVELPAALVMTALPAVLAVAGSGAAAVGKVSSLAIHLTKGALRAMFSSKVQFVVGVLLATTLIGAGTWAVARPRAEGPPATAAAKQPEQAGPQAVAAGQPPPREETEGTDSPRRVWKGLEAAEQRLKLQAAEQRLLGAEKVLAATRRRLEDQEDRWMKELIQARLNVQEARENTQRLETELSKVPEKGRFSIDIQQLHYDRDGRQERLRHARAAAAKPDDPAVKKLQQELTVVTEKLEKRLRQVQEEARREREPLIAALRKARMELYVAEEKLRQLRRREERDLAEADRDLAAAVDRVRQAGEARRAASEAPTPRADGRSAELEAKLDQLLREVTALRRDLRRQSGERKEKP